MFTGIIEDVGSVIAVKEDGCSKHFLIESKISKELKVDQSVAHSGVCLTVIKVDPYQHWVTAVDETLKKSNLGELKTGDVINLERCMLANARFDGHIVQGHVDQTAKCLSVKEVNGSWLYDFQYDSSLGNITVEKGSITINGVSLTCFNSEHDRFRVTIIPYTYEHTNFNRLNSGSIVNLEFDVIGKYVKRILSLK